MIFDIRNFNIPPTKYLKFLIVTKSMSSKFGISYYNIATDLNFAIVKGNIHPNQCHQIFENEMGSNNQ